MVVFEDLTDVDEWLDPLDYIAFWEAVAPWSLFSIVERNHCDGLIAGGKVAQVTILKGLKYIARDGLRDKLSLQHRRYHVVANQGLNSLH